jgi:hypothetical protein
MKKPGFFKITLTRFELIEKKPGFWEITLTPRNPVSALIEIYQIEKNLLS